MIIKKVNENKMEVKMKKLLSLMLIALIAMSAVFANGAPLSRKQVLFLMTG